MKSLHFILYLLCCVRVNSQAEDNQLDTLGLLLDSCEQDAEIIDFSDQMPIFYPNKYREINIYGQNITRELQMGFTREKNCDKVSLFLLKLGGGHRTLMTFTVPSPGNGFSHVRYYICAKQGEGNWTLLKEDSMGFFVYETLYTPILLTLLLLLSLCLSSLMSGLNIGLFTMDSEELEVLKGAGTAREKKYAKVILPVRRRGNHLLCSILITATLCNSISTVTANNFLSDWMTVVVTTITLVLLCEIIPQSICTTYPLALGAQTIYITKACMILTAPISYPLGAILDRLFGKGSALGTYNKERLRELLEMTKLASDEANIISGTLKLSYKTVEEIMTLSKDMFKLPITAVCDFETIATIMASGYSRIPIYVGDSSNIQYILLTKDLALLDPEDKVPVKVVVQSLRLKCHYIPKGTTVDKLLEIFKDSRSHMVFVVDDRTSDTIYNKSASQQIRVTEEKNVIGLVTFEDVLEEIFQMEINDETDMFSDNRIKKKIDSEYDLAKILQNAPKATQPSGNFKTVLFNFLAGIDVFSKTSVSPTVLRSMLNLDIYYSATSQKLPHDTVYVLGVPADHFLMIMEGEMEIIIGSEGLTFEVGAFQYFGVDALKLTSPFIPDYTLRAVKKTKYIKISRVLYDAAVLATQYERTQKTPKISNSEVYKYYERLIE